MGVLKELHTWFFHLNVCKNILGKVSKIQRYQTFFLETAGKKVLRGVDSTPPQVR